MQSASCCSPQNLTLCHWRRLMGTQQRLACHAESLHMSSIHQPFVQRRCAGDFTDNVQFISLVASNFRSSTLSYWLPSTKANGWPHFAQKQDIDSQNLFNIFNVFANFKTNSRPDKRKCSASISEQRGRRERGCRDVRSSISLSAPWLNSLKTPHSESTQTTHK